MNEEMKFWLKVVRNAFILSGMMFGAIWAATEILNWGALKPVAVFFVTYFFSELGRHYKLKPSTKEQAAASQKTFVFY